MNWDRKKRGFTLVELLAVIVILGIVLMVAVPGTIALIQKTRMNAFLYSADNLVYAVHLESYDGKLEAKRYEIEDGKLNLPVKIDGLLEGSGYIEVDDHYNVRLSLSNKKYCAKKEFADMNVSLYELNACIDSSVEPNLDQSLANVPKLDSSMVPVLWKEDHWVKADKTNTDVANQWYDYRLGQWANVAVVKTAMKQKYRLLEDGSPIKEEDVIGYFVWIPKFSYRLMEGEGERAFSVHFGDTVESGYVMHPAFTWGTQDLRGFWMGKYELSGTLQNFQVLPEKGPLKSTKLKDVYDALADLNRLKKIDHSNNLLAVIHLVKNTEWGATTILSQSSYGRCTDTGCTAVEKNRTWLTGHTTAKASYHTPEGMKASTTGTIYGVYDMNGGAWEFTMGTSNPGVVDATMPMELYDDYHEGHGLVGDLTTEDGTSGWYGSNANFVQGYKSYLVRGGDVNTNNSSLFWYDADSPNGGFRNGFRIAYTVEAHLQ